MRYDFDKNTDSKILELDLEYNTAEQKSRGLPETLKFRYTLLDAALTSDPSPICKLLVRSIIFNKTHWRVHKPILDYFQGLPEILPLQQPTPFNYVFPNYITSCGSFYKKIFTISHGMDPNGIF